MGKDDEKTLEKPVLEVGEKQATADKKVAVGEAKWRAKKVVVESLLSDDKKPIIPLEKINLGLWKNITVGDQWPGHEGQFGIYVSSLGSKVVYLDNKRDATKVMDFVKERAKDKEEGAIDFRVAVQDFVNKMNEERQRVASTERDGDSALVEEKDEGGDKEGVLEKEDSFDTKKFNDLLEKKVEDWQDGYVTFNDETNSFIRGVLTPVLENLAYRAVGNDSDIEEYIEEFLLDVENSFEKVNALFEESNPKTDLKTGRISKELKWKGKTVAVFEKKDGTMDGFDDYGDGGLRELGSGVEFLAREFIYNLRKKEKEA